MSLPLNLYYVPVFITTLINALTFALRILVCFILLIVGLLEAQINYIAGLNRLELDHFAWVQQLNRTAGSNSTYNTLKHLTTPHRCRTRIEKVCLRTVRNTKVCKD
jgi:hypothetical protein